MKQDKLLIKIAKLFAVIIAGKFINLPLLVVVSLILGNNFTDEISIAYNLTMGSVLGAIGYSWIKDSKNGRIVYGVIIAITWVILNLGFIAIDWTFIQNRKRFG
ncbi:hypothetical protein HYS92_00695 [Candidatus Daviesbacteria bacterium]|nr:hypothetical protein [Candidatus Daviesbacteria bacterium]